MTTRDRTEETRVTETPRAVPEAAERALAEAEARRRSREPLSRPMPTEVDGRPGPEPVRYGDWENKGIASDF